jgi:hypothetical protein
MLKSTLYLQLMKNGLGLPDATTDELDDMSCSASKSKVWADFETCVYFCVQLLLSYSSHQLSNSSATHHAGTSVACRTSRGNPGTCTANMFP